MRIGIDLGGTKIAGIVINGNGDTVAKGCVKSFGREYSKNVDAIAELVNNLEIQVGGRATHVGVGVPGSVNMKTGEVCGGDQAGMRGRNIMADLSVKLGNRVRVANDANCFALSEAQDGAAAGYGVVFGVILGTGVGGGIVVDHKILNGGNAMSGEWGHMPLPNPTEHEIPGPDCNCGIHGHIEAWLSGGALVNDHIRHGGECRTAQDIALLFERGDKAAMATLDRYKDRLARSLAVVANILDPDVFVIGGGLSNIAYIYDGLDQLTGKYSYAEIYKTPILKNLHGANSGVRGAAWL